MLQRNSRISKLSRMSEALWFRKLLLLLPLSVCHECIPLKWRKGLVKTEGLNLSEWQFYFISIQTVFMNCGPLKTPKTSWQSVYQGFIKLCWSCQWIQSKVTILYGWSLHPSDYHNLSLLHLKLNVSSSVCPVWQTASEQKYANNVKRTPYCSNIHSLCSSKRFSVGEYIKRLYGNFHMWSSLNVQTNFVKWFLRILVYRNHLKW